MELSEPPPLGIGSKHIMFLAFVILEALLDFLFGNVAALVIVILWYHSIYQVTVVLIFRLFLTRSLFFHQPTSRLFVLYRVFL